MADAKISALADVVTLAAGDKVAVADASDLTVSKSATMTEVQTFVMASPVITAPTITTGITPTSDDGAALGTTAKQFSDLFLASGGVINQNNGSATITGGVNIWTFSGSGANGNGIVLPAGGTSIAPLTMTAGTNLTGQGTAGANEYDGKCFYTTPVTNARGVSPSMMYSIVSASDFSLATTTGVQSAFASTGDVWSLAANTSYFFEGVYQITKTTTSITVAMAFACSNAPTSIMYTATSWASAINTTVTASSEIIVNSVASQVITIASTGAVGIRFQGILRTGSATTVTPQVNWSANTTLPVMKANSFIRFWPIGTDTNNILGNVA